MKLLDANYILRYLLNDQVEMAKIAEDCILNNLTAVTTEVFAEVVYVLEKVYKLSKETICDVLLSFLENVQTAQPQIIRRGLCRYGITGLDFVDCILLAYHEIHGAEIYTFDKKLKKLFDA